MNPAYRIPRKFISKGSLSLSLFLCLFQVFPQILALCQDDVIRLINYQYKNLNSGVLIVYVMFSSRKTIGILTLLI